MYICLALKSMPLVSHRGQNVPKARSHHSTTTAVSYFTLGKQRNIISSKGDNIGGDGPLG